jgi:putative peptide zinc metalloprotease protein
MIAIEGRLSQLPSDPAVRSRTEKDRNDARSEFKNKKDQLQLLDQLIAENEVLKAPRSGVVMSIPKREEWFKTWDRGESPPFCTIGDRKQLRLLVPITPIDYREMKQNLEKARAKNPDKAYLEVSILPKNRRDMELVGRVSQLPDTDEKNVPVALTHQGGGSLATKAGGDPNVQQPLSQTYLISVDIMGTAEELATLAPGTLAMAKVHMEWRSLAWWTWRGIASALDVGLW